MIYKKIWGAERKEVLENYWNIENNSLREAYVYTHTNTYAVT